MQLTRAQETQLRRTGREAMEKVMFAAQQATQNGIQRATARVTAVNGDVTADVDFGTADYPMPLTGLRYTTSCSGMQVGDRVLVDTVGNQPLITGILANADNGPYVMLYDSTALPGTAPNTVSGTGDLSQFSRLKVFGCTGEWRRCYCEVCKPMNNGYAGESFTLAAMNGSSGNAFLKMTDYIITTTSSGWKIAPQSWYEYAGTSSSTKVNSGIGPSIVRVIGVRVPRLT